MRVSKADGAHLSGVVVELILVGETLANHILIFLNVKEFVMSAAAETEGIKKTGVFIGRLGGGYRYSASQRYNNFDLIVILGEEGKDTYFGRINIRGESFSFLL